MRKKVSWLIIIFVIGVSTSVSALDLGYMLSDNLSGISLRKSEGVFRPQFIGQIYSSGDSVYIETGIRGLYSLGRSGIADRYLGAGFSYTYNGRAMNSYHGYGGQVFVGVDFPLGTSPFQLSVEAGIVGNKEDQS